MRTLDEVIKNFEICRKARLNLISCDGCTYAIGDNDFCIDCNEIDVLEWLKGYRTHIELDKLRDKYGETSQITCPKCHSEFVILPDANNPLSWEQLKQMTSKPVWVEYNFQIGDKEFRDKSKRWCIIGKFKPWHDTEITITENGFVLSKNEQVKCWQAYRKERS